MRRAAFVLLAVAVPFVGCRTGDPLQRVVLKDRAELCVVDPAGDGGYTAPVTIPRDQPMRLLVRSPCLGSCAVDRKAKCSVRRELDKLIVSSEISWSVPWVDPGDCRGRCTYLEATCNAEAVPGASLTLVHGAMTRTFDTPARLATACISSQSTVLDASVPPDAASDAAPPAPPASVVAAAAPPSTGAPPTPKVGDVLCALPFPAKGKTNKAPIGISVARPNPCEGASCAVPAKAPKCTLKKQGNRIVVKTDLPPASGKPRQPCTDDCPKMVVSCRTEPLAPGSYVVELGEDKLEVKLPLPKETCSQ